MTLESGSGPTRRAEARGQKQSLKFTKSERTAVYRFPRILAAITFALTIATITTAQTKSFTPVEGANLKAKIDNAIVQGKAGAAAGLFWVGYQFEVRPGVGIDFELVDVQCRS